MINGAKAILITGAGGFVGSRLTRKLVDRGNEIHIIAREKSGTRRLEEISPQLNIHRGDITDAKFLKKLIRKIKPHGVFHFAASTVMSGAAAPPEELVKTNLIGSINLIAALDEVNYDYLINTGTFTEYGMKNRPVKENDSCEPMEVYSLTKLAQTLYCQAAARTKERPIITFRIFTPYGPAIQKGRLVYNVIYNALRNQDIKLTKSLVARDYIFVDDIAELYIEAAIKARNLRGEIFNAASGQKTSLGILTEKIIKMTDSKSKVLWNAVPQVSYDSDNWQADMTKTFSKFQWRPKYNLDTGLAKTIGWFKAFL